MAERTARGAWCPDCGAPVRPGVERVCGNCGFPVMFLADDDRDEPLPVGRAPGQPGEPTVQLTAVDLPPAFAVQEEQPPPPAGQAVRCPRCGYDNALGRVLCERCALAFAPQHRLVPPGPLPPAPAVAADRRGWRTALLVAAVLLLAVVVGVVVGRTLLG